MYAINDKAFILGQRPTLSIWAVVPSKLQRVLVDLDAFARFKDTGSKQFILPDWIGLGGIKGMRKAVCHAQVVICIHAPRVETHGLQRFGQLGS